MQTIMTAPHRGATGASSGPGGAPNAALLIDFDNVTMGIRSDLTRQLKELLNSDIIKGKVAVQRAYADWRRYAQYIVPLSEASVDLIFAPAYGSSKKNATDIRLAIDALELVFTRPEIGTFILLSGDSDFSSLVLKLKEYGKYVIGVGLRESASDLLVQNCDEYFSYSTLTGLTRAGEEDTVGALDAWELAERAVNQMAADEDVMRSDRLKQVMLELDPTFDEGELGFTKFNKFLVEAAGRDRLALRKLDNGQYEVRPFEQALAEAAPEAREERPRGRGRRDRKEEQRPRQPREDRAAAVAEAEAEPAPHQREPEPRRERREVRARPEARPAAEAPKVEQRAAARPALRERRADELQAGYDLVRRAVQDLVQRPGDSARDSDIKRKMLELEPGWDESNLGFTKFSRFLRQAHDAEVIDLARSAEGYYEARPGRAVAGAAPERKERGRERERKERTRPREASARATAAPATSPEREVEAAAKAAPTEDVEPVAEAAIDRRAEPVEPVAEVGAEAVEPVAAGPGEHREREGREADRGPGRGRDRRRERVATEAGAEAEAAAGEPTVAAREEDVPEEGARTEEAAAEAPAVARPPTRAVGFGGRRGRRGAAEGPPPLLPGQVVGRKRGAAEEQTVAGPEEPAEPADEIPADMARDTAPVGQSEAAAEAGAGPKDDEPEDVIVAAPAVPAREPVVEAAAPADIDEALTTEEPAASEAPGASPVDPTALGLPTERGAVIRYLSNSYQGVGQKTAEALIDAFSAEGVFQGLNDQPDRVKEILGGGRRTEVLLNAWQRDYRRRTTGGHSSGPQAESSDS